MLFPPGNVLEYLMGKFIVGILFFIRVLAMMVAGPLFSVLGIPPLVKVGIAALLAAAMAMIAAPLQPTIIVEPFALVPLVLKETLVGALIGFCASMVMVAARFAGGLADMEIGFQTALLFDPNAGVPTLLGELQAMSMLMLFLGMGGHHALIEAIYASAELVPLGEFTLRQVDAVFLVRMATGALILGVKIAAPVIVAIFLVHLALSLLARIAPQVNIFALSMHIKVVIGLLVLLGTVPLVIVVMRNALGWFDEQLATLLVALRTR
ncbi:MAG: flagellar biosynthetic protein FliR [Candidatus Kapabacteria bacterium]|nr:flagellar biosynthetic protein FliR [Candidatus Kapabacteria bacterium]MCS7303456.1 flagellar biosynthetic protein FliR [Candidatus Kapabacteria bacterium]